MADIHPSTNLETQCSAFDVDSVEIPKPEKLKGLDFNDLTSNATILRKDDDLAIDFIVNGDGMFDKMMETVTKHLKAQTMGHRIREEDYASIYTDAMKHTMSLCFDAWMKKAEIEAQAELIRMQAVQIELSMKKVPYEIKKLAADTEHVCELTIHERIKERHTESQILLTDAQTCLTNKQCEHETHKIDLTDAQTCLTSKQCEHEDHKIELTDAQTEQVKETTVHEKLKEDTTKAQTEQIKETTVHEKLKEDLTEAQTCVTNAQCEHEAVKQDLTTEQICIAKETCKHEAVKILQTEAQTTQIQETTVHEKIKEKMTEAQTEQIKETTVHEKLKEKLTEAQTSNTTTNTAQLLPAQANLANCQAEKACREVDLVDQQICKAKFECEKTMHKQLEVMECQKKLYCAQADKTDSESEESDAKKALYMRQVEGYDENFLRDILKIQADAWNVGFSVSKDTFMAADGIPIIMQSSEITDYFKKWVEPNLDRFTYGRKNIKGQDITPDKAPSS